MSKRKKKKIVEIPQLSRDEQLVLQNILLRMQVEEERVEKYNLKKGVSLSTISKLEQDLNIWNKKFNKKLKKKGLDISNVNIDAENGRVSIANVHELLATSAEK